MPKWFDCAASTRPEAFVHTPFDRSDPGSCAAIPGKPSAVDVHVGGRVRQRRQGLGLSQEQLGAAIGLTFQQVQKYECGANRIGASRLFDIAGALGVPISFFFEGLLDGADLESGRFNSREMRDLVGAYQRINDRTVRKRLLEMAKTLSRQP
jgi:transcriptional regulator with XRE-family HTH domain